MSETDLMQTIKAFRAALHKPNDEPLDSEAYIDGETTNRGQKLKIGASDIHRDQLDGYKTSLKYDTVEFDGYERQFIQRKRTHSFEERKSKKAKSSHKAGEDKDKIEEIDESESGSEEDDDGGDVVDPYKDVDIAKLLAPITKPADVVTHPAMSKIFQSDTLRNLAQQAIDIIEYEQNNANCVNRLMEIFLGEDPKFYKVNKMNLPEYDHDLVDGETSEELKYGLKKPKNELIIEAIGDKGVNNVVNAEEYLQNLQNNETNKRITRKLDSNFQEVDPFFALPKFEIDETDGVDPKLATDIRSFTQIVLQRNQEYIRSLQKIRSGLVRAERLKDQVYKWCREMNGDYDKK